jgi:hypothetical protein
MVQHQLAFRKSAGSLPQLSREREVKDKQWYTIWFRALTHLDAPGRMVLKWPDLLASKNLAAQLNRGCPRGVDVGQIQAEVIEY